MLFLEQKLKNVYFHLKRFSFPISHILSRHTLEYSQFFFFQAVSIFSNQLLSFLSSAWQSVPLLINGKIIDVWILSLLKSLFWNTIYICFVVRKFYVILFFCDITMNLTDFGYRDVKLNILWKTLLDFLNSF